MAKKIIELGRPQAMSGKEILIYDQIGGFWGGINAMDIAHKIQSFGEKDQIDVRLNSPGGDVFEGVAIYNLLSQHRGKVIIHVDAQALSIASVIAMAGDEINIAENAWMMIHEPWGYAVGTATELRREADLIDGIKGQIENTYVSRTKQTAKAISDMVSAETWMTAEEALAMGFATSISETKKMAAMVTNANLSKFKHPPEAFINRVNRDVEASKRPRLAERQIDIAEMNKIASKIKAQSGRRTG